MAQRSAKSYFDFDQFIGDVNVYRVRQCLTVLEMADKADITFNGMRRILNSETLEPSFGNICILAEMCDLSLDHYRLTGARVS
jgi:hypothetical protein